MLQPARRKYRKEQKGRNTGLATRGAKVSFGEYGLKAIPLGGYIRMIGMFPPKPGDAPGTIRATSKGSPEYWVAEIQPGKVLYEMDGVDETLAREAFRLAAAKLPLETTFVTRHLG